MASSGKPSLPDLPEPGSTARFPYSGSVDRARPLFRENRHDWKVEVVPLEGAGGLGAQLGGGRQKPRAIFEVRAEYIGTGLPEFGSQPGTKRIETYNTEDVELARAVAIDAAERLRRGEREIMLNVIAEARGG